MNWKRIHLQVVDSTNSYMRHEVIETNVCVVADYQSAGRGQGSNRWESAPSANLLFSVKVSPENIAANRQFVLSMAGALALKDALDPFASGFSLKWPNDIYWCDRKISGTLIETTIQCGLIQDCIFGVGLNVNQREFRGYAVNPVSLWQIIHRETDREQLLSTILDCFGSYLHLAQTGGAEHIWRLYNEHLYRRRGFYPYEDSGGRFDAEIQEVAPSGHLILRDRSGRSRQYELKEIKYILNG